MNRSIFLFFLFLSLSNNSNCQNLDSSFSLFGNYVLRVSIFDSETVNDFISTKNATIRFSKPQNGKTRTIFRDTTFCRHVVLKRKDFNGDGIKDILIFYDYDVRGNEMYHLYIVDSNNKRLIPVKGFENVKNPEFDKKRNRLECHVISGRNYTAFYKINKLNQLVDLGRVDDE